LSNNGPLAGISSPRSEEHELLLHCWATHYSRQIIKEQQDLFPEEDLIEQYMFNQWKFALNNTYYTVDNWAWQNEFNRDFSSFPRHLGVTWHIGRPPQEIYEMARKIITTCLDFTPNSGKFEAFPEHLRREVSKCVEEISQQGVYSRTVLAPDYGLTHCVVVENYLQGLENPSSFVQSNSAVPAIVIKRHHLLEHRYDTRTIFDQMIVGDDGLPLVIPTIDQF